MRLLEKLFGSEGYLLTLVSRLVTLPIYGDNQASVLSAYNPSNHQTSKHIDTRKNFNEEKVTKKLVKLEYVPTTENIVDLFTKALDRNKMTYFRDRLIQLDDSGEINES